MQDKIIDHMILNNEGADKSAPCRFVNSSNGFDESNPYLYLLAHYPLLITHHCISLLDT